jgi:RimJ/RimL family protein N-acetyltransferase
MAEIEITFREAIPEDAAEIIAVMKKMGEETEYLVLDESGLNMTTEMLALSIGAIYDSPNNMLLLALADEKIVATASIKASDEYRVAHIGEVGISVLKEYWGIGLGTALLEELIYAAEQTELARLELTVQKRNERAIHLYKKLGFKLEGVKLRGARDDEGHFLDVCVMRLLIN